MKKHRKMQVHVEDLATAGQRFVDAWRRTERGDAVREEHLSFESFEGLPATLSPKRIELIRFVRRRPNLSIAAVARELGRDYKRVHGDIRALEAAGLLEEGDNGLLAPFAAVEAQLSFSRDIRPRFPQRAYGSSSGTAGADPRFRSHLLAASASRREVAWQLTVRDCRHHDRAMPQST
jgi:predicted transcriptional regulator